MSIQFECPLQWPEGWPRSRYGGRRWSGIFRTNLARTKERLENELRMLAATEVVVSTNARIAGRGGYLLTDEAMKRLDEPGVSIFFKYKGRDMAMARDAYDTPWGNLHSLTLAIEHLRGLERHGGGQMMDKAFTGFAALPPPKHWSKVFGISPEASMAEITEAYRAKAREVGAGFQGEAALAELNLARDAARKERAA